MPQVDKLFRASSQASNKNLSLTDSSSTLFLTVARKFTKLSTTSVNWLWLTFVVWTFEIPNAERVLPMYSATAAIHVVFLWTKLFLAAWKRRRWVIQVKTVINPIFLTYLGYIYHFINNCYEILNRKYCSCCIKISCQVTIDLIFRRFQCLWIKQYDKLINTNSKSKIL